MGHRHTGFAVGREGVDELKPPEARRVRQPELDDEDALDLIARAEAARAFPEFGLDDPWAEAIVDRLAWDRSAFLPSDLRCSLARTRFVDDVVRAFLARQPGALVLSLSPGLCTRFARVDDGASRWVDMATEPWMDVKERYAHGDPRYVVAMRGPLHHPDWMKALGSTLVVPTLVVDQGAFRRAPAEERLEFLLRASRDLPRGTELLLDGDARALLRASEGGRAHASLETLGERGQIVRFPRLRTARVPPAVPSGVRSWPPSGSKRAAAARFRSTALRVPMLARVS